MSLFICLFLSSSIQESKVILLAPDTCLLAPLSPDDAAWIKGNGGQRGEHKLKLEYRHYSAHAVLSGVLPVGTNEIPTSFEVVGHIAHMNLRKEFLPYKTLVGGLSALTWYYCTVCCRSLMACFQS